LKKSAVASGLILRGECQQVACNNPPRGISFDKFKERLAYRNFGVVYAG
jgi:hypothetical protein